MALFHEANDGSGEGAGAGGGVTSQGLGYMAGQLLHAEIGSCECTLKLSWSRVVLPAAKTPRGILSWTYSKFLKASDQSK